MKNKDETTHSGPGHYYEKRKEKTRKFVLTGQGVKDLPPLRGR